MTDSFTHAPASSSIGGSCPTCRAPMQIHRFQRQLLGDVALDVCFACQGIWFDEYESAQLAPAGVLELFRLLHEHHDDLRQPWRDTLHCPRCDERLMHGLDRTRSGQFAYHRCLQGHGRFTAFSAFLLEKGFVRQLSGVEIEDLARKVQTIRCSGCGAPVDIKQDTACPHCRAPIVILDPDAVAMALDNFEKKAQKQTQRDPNAFADALIASEKMKSQTARERGTSLADTDVSDLVIGGAGLLWTLLNL